MLQFAPGVKVYLACKPVDMCRGFDGLAADVAQTLHADPYSRAAFVFRSRRGDYPKILTWDGPGLCLFAKRLEKGRFVWPPIVEGALHLTSAQLALPHRRNRLAANDRAGSAGTPEFPLDFRTFSNAPPPILC